MRLESLSNLFVDVGLSVEIEVSLGQRLNLVRRIVIMLWSVVHEDVWLGPGRHAGFLHSIGLPGMLDSIVASKVRIVKLSRVSFLVDWANAVKFSFRRRIHM